MAEDYIRFEWYWRYLLVPSAVRTAMTANGPGVAGVDGMIEPEECAAEVLDAIVNERFLAAPHKEVLEYVSEKGMIETDGFQACNDYKHNLLIS